METRTRSVTLTVIIKLRRFADPSQIVFIREKKDVTGCVEGE